MTQRAVISTKTLSYAPVTEAELAVGIEYAKAEHGKVLDHDMLKVLVNTVMRRRGPKTILPFLAATVVRETIPNSNKLEAPKIEAYKSGIMKIMSTRRVRQQKKDAAKRKAGIPTPARPKAVDHPEGPKRKGQLLLL